MAGRSRQLNQNKQLPGQHGYVITPDDNTDCETTRGLYVGTSGDVAVIMADGDVLTYPNLAAGIVHPLSVSRVKATGTTAVNIRGVV